MTTEDLPGGSAPGSVHPAGVVPQPPPVRDAQLADVREPEFPIALRGYDREAVDAYVDAVNRVLADLESRSSPQAAIRHALDQVSEETRGILERAHDTADEITARSQAQASERVERAEREAREIVKAAETQARMLDTDTDEIWQERKRLIDDVQRVSDQLAELADEAARRFPPETPDSSADTVPIEQPPDPPPPPPADAEASEQGGPAA